MKLFIYIFLYTRDFIISKYLESCEYCTIWLNRYIFLNGGMTPKGKTFKRRHGKIYIML